MVLFVSMFEGSQGVSKEISSAVSRISMIELGISALVSTGSRGVHAQVLQRGLPRPKTLDSLPAPRPQAALPGLGLKETAEALLQNEVILLLQYDAAKYPIKVAVPCVSTTMLLESLQQC